MAPAFKKECMQSIMAGQARCQEYEVLVILSKVSAIRKQRAMNPGVQPRVVVVMGNITFKVLITMHNIYIYIL